MTAATTPEQPRTAAGRALLAAEYGGFPMSGEQQEFVAAILAIEAEMYDLASNEGYHSGIASTPAHPVKPQSVVLAPSNRAPQNAGRSVGALDVPVITSDELAAMTVAERTAYIHDRAVIAESKLVRAADEGKQG